MENISGFGTSITIVALQSFPMGFKVSKFADDEDPIKVKEMEAFGYERLYDGSIFSFSKAAPVEVHIGVIANTTEDINLKILLANKKGGFSIFPFDDITTMIVDYPDGGKVVLSQGTILSGPALDGIAANGRRVGNVYKFVFGNVTGMQSSKQLLTGAFQSVLGFIG